MTNDELRDWIKVAKDIEFSPKDYEQDRKCANILITLAERVIEIGESCPKELKGHKYVDYEGSWKDGYNQAITDISSLFTDKEQTK